MTWWSSWGSMSWWTMTTRGSMATWWTHAMWWSIIGIKWGSSKWRATRGWASHSWWRWSPHSRWSPHTWRTRWSSESWWWSWWASVVKWWGPESNKTKHVNFISNCCSMIYTKRGSPSSYINTNTCKRTKKKTKKQRKDDIHCMINWAKGGLLHV